MDFTELFAEYLGPKDNTILQDVKEYIKWDTNQRRVFIQSPGIG